MRHLSLGLLLASLLTAGGCGDESASTSRVSQADELAYFISQILVEAAPKRDEGSARRRAFDLRDLVRSGTAFSEVARRNSDDPSATDGGFIGFVPAGHDTALAGAIQALEPGDLSLPIRSPLGFHVLYRHRYEEGREMERHYWRVVHGFFIPFDGQRGANGRTRQAALDEAERALARLKSGEISLAEAAKPWASPRARDEDAFLGVTARRPHSEAVFDALNAVPEGAFAHPVETPDGIGVLWRGYLTRCLVRHILIQHSKVNPHLHRFPPEARAMAEKVLADALADPGRWDQLVRNHSDDSTSRGDRGSLQVMGPGSMPPEFVEAVRTTPPGQVVPRVVETVFGFHVIWRVD